MVLFDLVLEDVVDEMVVWLSESTTVTAPKKTRKSGKADMSLVIFIFVKCIFQLLLPRSFLRGSLYPTQDKLLMVKNSIDGKV